MGFEGPSPILKRVLAMLQTRASFEDPCQGNLKRNRECDDHDTTMPKKMKADTEAHDDSEVRFVQLPPEQYVLG